MRPENCHKQHFVVKELAFGAVAMTDTTDTAIPGEKPTERKPWSTPRVIPSTLGDAGTKTAYTHEVNTPAGNYS